MTDLWLPDVRIASASPKLLDNTARFTSPLSGTVRSVSRPGDRWGVRLDYQNLQGLDRARLESFIARMRGAANRVLWSPSDFPQRGSFPSKELFTNNTFANGTTGWTNAGTGTMAVIDRRLRYTFTGGSIGVNQGVANLTANFPFVARYALVDGKGTPLALNGLSSYIEGSSSSINANAVSFEGLNVLALTVDSNSGTQYPFFVGTSPAGQLAGNYCDTVWTSLSQCMLVDNAPNLLLQSNSFATSPWNTSNASAGNNGTAAPDGSLTAQFIAENTTNAGHWISQNITGLSAAAADYAFSISFEASNRSWAWVQVQENTGSTALTAYINLSTGALGNLVTGTNWANLRAFVVNQGNGWYRLTVIGRKTNAATSITVFAGPATGNGAATYAGVTSPVAILFWHASFTQSSVPVRDALTTTSAAAATPQTGSAYYVKGLPTSQSGLLLPGDWFEVNKELKRCTAQLDSDASGLGYLQFSPPIRTSANDNDPVIVNTPMGRFILANNQNGWQSTPGPNAQPFGTYSLDLIEASA